MKGTPLVNYVKGKRKIQWAIKAKQPKQTENAIAKNSKNDQITNIRIQRTT